ncbi:hypothetical protein NMY22_g5529 [Coprinellus aureogranulatus]|nr:hypothetical protein NMY22_g5529 [Coprinellus aureogranulatus]
MPLLASKKTAANDLNTRSPKATLSPPRSISAQEARRLPLPLQCELDTIVLLFDSRVLDAATNEGTSIWLTDQVLRSPGTLGRLQSVSGLNFLSSDADARVHLEIPEPSLLHIPNDGKRRSFRKRMFQRVQGISYRFARVRTCGLPAGKRCDMAPEFCAIDRSLNPDLISLAVTALVLLTVLSFYSLFRTGGNRRHDEHRVAGEPAKETGCLVTKLIGRRGDWYWKWVNGILPSVRAHPALRPAISQYKLRPPTFSILISTASHPAFQTLQIWNHRVSSFEGECLNYPFTVPMASSSLVVSRHHPFHPFSVNQNLRSLAIDGAVLLDQLSSASAFQETVLSSANLTSLTIGGLGECAWRMTDNVLPYFFQFLQSLPRLRSLAINDFVLQVPNSPPPIPPCVADSPVSVRKLTVTNCHSTSLSFLLDCLEPSELTLEACWFIESLPICDRLELCDVHPFDGLVERLLEWDGDELIIDSCPFIEEGVISRLIHRMEETQNAAWPGARLSFEGYPYAVRRRINEMLDIRSRM